ncbi:MAG: hypothetical protein KC425_24885 [Anaerolineales bacterium]|nr:hypothetical protein [Anaerolineales bacterium]
MTRTKGILAAGTLTGLVLITILALGWRNARAGAAVDAAATAVPQTVQLSGAGDAAQQNYTAELETAVQTLQDREAQYQQQIEAANQTIQELQAAQVQPASGGYYGDDDEWEEHEHEEHESHEYEGSFFGFGERDDD